MIQLVQNNHLFLKGVFFDEIQTFEDNMFKSNISDNDNENDDDDIKKQITYSGIPPKFYSIKSWVESTKNFKNRCWYCNCIFVNTPVFIPSYISNTNLGQSYDTHGIFCGFACAYTYLKSQHIYHENKTYEDKLNMLKMLYTHFYNKKIYDFTEVPDKCKLEIYGGNISMSDYKKELKRVNNLILNSGI